MASEKAIMNRCLVALSKLPGVRVWRNNTGTAWAGRQVVHLTPGQVIRANPGDVLIRAAQPIKFGLIGSPDIIGLRSVEITPDMVGRKIGQFIGIETKRPGGKASEQQRKFKSVAESLGGVCELATDEKQAVAAISKGVDNEN